MRISIVAKMITLSVLLVLIPSVIIGLMGYMAAERAVYNGIQDRLMDQAKDWKIIVESYEQEIVAQETRVRASAKNIVTAQTSITYELIRKALDDNQGKLPAVEKEDLLNRLNRQLVGKTGYIWILDYNGNYVLSKGRQRDGESIWNTQDVNGTYIIQDLVKIGQSLKGNEIGYYSYPWLNLGETEPREKIAAIIHFPELGWVVGISTYYDDLVDMGYRKRTVEHVKDLVAKQVIGTTGYIWVVDSKGTYQVSKNRLRDGEDISQSKDTNGVLFIQEAVKKAKLTDDADYIEYPWMNKGETVPRMKIAGLVYVPEWDWVIGTSAYYDDFSGTGALGDVRRTLITVGAISIVIGVLAAFVFARGLSLPLKKMSDAGNQIADGKLETQMPDIKSNDEIEDLSMTMNMLTGAFKFLRAEHDKVLVDQEKRVEKIKK